MIVLHHLDESRSRRVLWMLEELGLAYEIRHYQRNSETMLAPESLKQVHPLGKSPVITDGDLTLAESGAILDYLARRYGREHMIPPDDSPAFLDYTYWMHYAEGSLMPPLLLKLVFGKVRTSPMPFFVRPIARRIADGVDRAFIGPQTRTHMDFVDTCLRQREWLVGDRITAADIQMSYPLEAALDRLQIGTRYPAISDYVRRFQALPSYQRARAAEAG
ncbi:MAG: glutathione S-transferase [Ectothiorhodospiraceae bacterium]|nr:glutathione S-transferase [Ectothiorhodospiraceae bacterium]MCH8502698.1 glutathione S-transferase [Ectothiorhodospiraceae bacterium]